jgi:hypothetical protein
MLRRSGQEGIARAGCSVGILVVWPTAEQRRKAIHAATIGNATEWYDFGIFGFLAGSPALKFCPKGDRRAFGFSVARTVALHVFPTYIQTYTYILPYLTAAQSSWASTASLLALVLRRSRWELY